MLDFFKDLYLEANGFDMERVREIKKERREKNKKGLLDVSTRRVFLIFFSVFIVAQGLSLYYNIGTDNIISLIENIVFLICSIVVVISFLLKKKESDLVGIGAVVVIIILAFITPLLY